MSINILHISDLHFGTNSQNDKESTRYCDDYVRTFIDKLKESKELQPNYVIVSGDIANASVDMEYEKAIKFLNTIVKELDIPKKNVLICMGNHDISWDILKDKERGGIADKDLFKENSKYDNFKKFYDAFYKDEDGKQIQQFNTNPIFVEIIDEAHRIVFLGVNTCFHESNKDIDHYGFIEQEHFDNQIRDINTRYDDYVKFLVMHHNPSDLADEQHKVQNWRCLNYNSISKFPVVVFCGHIHKSDAETTIYGKDPKDAIHYIAVGSLFKKNTVCKYNLYTINDNSTKLSIKYYNYTHDTSPSKQYWQVQSDTKAATTISIREPAPKNDAFDVIMSDDNERTKQILEYQQKQVHHKSNTTTSSKSILDEIKDHKLYYSGHFHWDTDGNGENSKFRSHGYIDINHLVSHIESLETITQLYKEKIKEIQKNTTLDNTIIVSIGLECCVIGARLSVLFPDFGFSYIPREHKANDHIKIEKEIGFSDYDTVILIKDITFDAEEAIEIIEERFKNKNIHLVSLFYCGKKDKKKEILSGIENAHFYSLIDDIEIPRCDVSESECPIIKNNLQTIYKC